MMVDAAVVCGSCGAKGLSNCTCPPKEEPLPPWCDSPRCPRCKHAQCVPVEMSGLRTYDGDTLICVACGHGFVGTPEQEDQAWLSELQWLFKQEEEAAHG